MTAFSKQIIITASQASVWKVMANLGDIHKFNPNVSKSYYTTDQKDGIGASRICELIPAGIVKEVASEWHEGTGFKLDILPIEKAPPLKNIHATLHLEAQGSSSTQVTISMEYHTKLGILGRTLNALIIRSQMEKSISMLLQGLKINVETGAEIANPKSLFQLLTVA